MTLNSSARHIVAVGGSTETQACCVHSPVEDGGRSDHRELYGGRFARAPDSRWLLPFWGHVWENGGMHDYPLADLPSHDVAPRGEGQGVLGQRFVVKVISCCDSIVELTSGMHSRPSSGSRSRVHRTTMRH